MPPAATESHPTAPESRSHGYTLTSRIPGCDSPVEIRLVLTRDELYVPIAIRKPDGDGPFPVITMGRGNGHGGVAHVVQQVQRLSLMQDRMIERGYVVAYVNYRNEVPHLYETTPRSHNLPDDISGEVRTLKSAPTLDSDDFIATLRYLGTLDYVDAARIGAVGVSHGGEIILKAAAETTFACGVVIEGASHEFLGVETGPRAPRKGGELQYQNIEDVRRNADRKAAMERIRRIETPMLHVGRDTDHLQGIFQLAHEWMKEAGNDSTWASFDHSDHGYPFIYRSPDGAYRPDPVQSQAFELFMRFFDAHLKHRDQSFEGGGTS